MDGKVFLGVVVLVPEVVDSHVPTAGGVLHLAGYSNIWPNLTVVGEPEQVGQLDGRIPMYGRESKTVSNMDFQIALLVTSGSTISIALYFLWRITTFPDIGNVDATLIGVSITCAIFLCAYGIGSGKGNPIESSLLVRTHRRKLLQSLLIFGLVFIYCALHIPNVSPKIQKR